MSGQMRRPHVGAVIAIILLAACTHDIRGSRAVTSETQETPTTSAPAATEPAPTVESQTGPQAAASAAGSAPQAPAANPPTPAGAPTTAVPSSPPAQSVAGTPKSRPSKPAAGPSGSASPTPATAAAAAATPPARPPKAAAPPPLDLKGLEQRLRDTRAIGVFTKLSLKNQVDDLLVQFRAFHQGQSAITVGQLRQKYELLFIKVVTLLQDGDPVLASAISSSREAIWNVLTDPQKFAAIANST